jgi:hypothetical protein
LFRGKVFGIKKAYFGRMLKIRQYYVLQLEAEIIYPKDSPAISTYLICHSPTKKIYNKYLGLS